MGIAENVAQNDVDIFRVVQLLLARRKPLSNEGCFLQLRVGQLDDGIAVGRPASEQQVLACSGGNQQAAGD